MKKQPINLSASVRQRLLNRARTEHRPFSELLQYYAMERFLYRLTLSEHCSRFVLKGALMLQVWQSPEFRPTMDIDMLGRTSNSEPHIRSLIRDVLTVKAPQDGLLFDPDTISSETITQDADYQGQRVLFYGHLDRARIRIQIDIGFGDVVHPEPEMAELPTLLDFPAPHLLCYSRESAIAEKFQAMIQLGLLNSRVKDFYDIWLLSRQFPFDGQLLSEAIRLTFAQRQTVIPPQIESFGEAFIRSRRAQWESFRRRLGQDHLPASFPDIVSGVALFLNPIAQALSTGNTFIDTWPPAGPWSESPQAHRNRGQDARLS